ncbi:MAG: class I SAM-dependent methyltransferase [Bacteroidetes bacterium]|nr:class I SAM-dependent methyltransferase [Bacteroidota bacterium]
MKRNYWEKMASNYQEEIFDVLQHDKKKWIAKAIKTYANSQHQVIDIGCAVGKWLPLISPLFKKVIALDISSNNLKIAQSTYPNLKNVNYQQGDMSNNRFRVAPAELGICINALLTPHAKDRFAFFINLTRCIKPGGILILTVPSLESYLFTRIIQQQFKIDTPQFAEKLTKDKAVRHWKNLKQGVVNIDEVPHKHFLQEELKLNLVQHHFEPIQFKKIEYSWNTEFVNPPQWLKQPLPWDWMVMAKRSKP